MATPAAPRTAWVVSGYQAVHQKVGSGSGGAVGGWLVEPPPLPARARSVGEPPERADAPLPPPELGYDTAGLDWSYPEEDSKVSPSGGPREAWVSYDSPEGLWAAPAWAPDGYDDPTDLATGAGACPPSTAPYYAMAPGANGDGDTKMYDYEDGGWTMPSELESGAATTTCVAVPVSRDAAAAAVPRAGAGAGGGAGAGADERVGESTHAPSSRGGSTAVPTLGGLTAAEINELLTSPTRDWNSEFQSLLDALPSPEDASLDTTGTGDDKTKASPLDMLTRLRSLVSGFRRLGSRVGRVIIAQQALPDARRPIKPVDAGGVAGGDKYIAAGLFFKRVNDTHGLYGGDGPAGRVAAHEMRGAAAYVKAGVEGLRAPLMGLFEFRGCRLLVSALLPVGDETLIYGSPDAGRTLAYDASAHAAMTTAGSVLNLKPHRVCTVNGKGGKVIVGAVDMEVHRGMDGRLYVLDAARVYPPQPPSHHIHRGLLIRPGKYRGMDHVDLQANTWLRDASEAIGARHLAVSRAGDGAVICVARQPGLGLPAAPKPSGVGVAAGGDGAAAGAHLGPVNAQASQLLGREVRGLCVWFKPRRGTHLYEQLRPELVAANPVPLSSDVFTFFGLHGAKEHNGEASQAYRRLTEVIVPALARDIDTLRVSCDTGPQLSAAFHSRGVNLRLLPVVRAHVNRSNALARQRLLTEMVVRAVKCEFRRHARSVGAVAGVVYRRMAASFLNVLFGKDAASDTFWTTRIYLLLRHKYGDVFAPDEVELEPTSDGGKRSKAALLDVRTAVRMVPLFEGVLRSTGVVLTKEASRAYRGDPTRPWSTPFTADDVADVRPVPMTLLAWDARSLVDYIRTATKACGGDATAEVAAVTRVFGEGSRYAAESRLSAAYALHEAGDKAAAEEIAAEVWAQWGRKLVASPATFSVLWLWARAATKLEDRASRLERLHNMLKYYHGSSTVNYMPDRTSPGLVNMTAGHPFLVFIGELLLQAQWRLESITSSVYATQAALATTFPFPHDPETCRRTMGRELPATCLLLGSERGSLAGLDPDKPLPADVVEKATSMKNSYADAAVNSVVYLVDGETDYVAARARGHRNLDLLWEKEATAFHNTAAILHAGGLEVAIQYDADEDSLDKSTAEADTEADGGLSKAGAAIKDAPALAEAYPHLFRWQRCTTCVEAGTAMCTHAGSWWAHPVGSFVRWHNDNKTVTSTGAYGTDNYSVEVLVSKSRAGMELMFISGVSGPTSDFTHEGTPSLSTNETFEFPRAAEHVTPAGRRLVQCRVLTEAHVRSFDFVPAPGGGRRVPELVAGVPVTLPAGDGKAGGEDEEDVRCVAVMCDVEDSVVEFKEAHMKIANSCAHAAAVGTTDDGAASRAGATGELPPLSQRSLFPLHTDCDSLPSAGSVATFSSVGDALLGPELRVELARSMLTSTQDGAEAVSVGCYATRLCTMFPGMPPSVSVTLQSPDVPGDRVASFSDNAISQGMRTVAAQRVVEVGRLSEEQMVPLVARAREAMAKLGGDDS